MHRKYLEIAKFKRAGREKDNAGGRGRIKKSKKTDFLCVCLCV